MRRGICPKCGTATVRAANNGIAMGDRPNQTFLRPHLGPGFRGIASNCSTQLWSFACVTCGFVELYVLDPAGIAFIDAQWAQVPPTAAPPPATEPDDPAQGPPAAPPDHTPPDATEP